VFGHRHDVKVCCCLQRGDWWRLTVARVLVVGGRNRSLERWLVSLLSV